ncbi:MAG: exodeoxyribonuclease VII small subunit [Eubacteriales bacterium]|nr:exodeoxyribonuclease VII small subunit [Eubacteriales bacterium]
MAKTQTIEDSFARLENIISDMEKEDITLDEAFKLYKEGIKLVENCNGMLDKVEKQIVLINDRGEQVETDGTF